VLGEADPSLPLRVTFLRMCQVSVRRACSRLRRSLPRVWCQTGAPRLFGTTLPLPGAAQPRDHPAREGQGVESLTHSEGGRYIEYALQKGIVGH
jgi:hypothetical protein